MAPRRDPSTRYFAKIDEYEEKARMALAALPDSVVFRLRLLIAAAEEEYKRKSRLTAMGTSHGRQP